MGQLKDRYEFTNTFVQCAQLKHAIPARWRKLIFDYSDIKENDLYPNHHVIKGAITLFLYKSSSKEIYSILISNTVINQFHTSIMENCLKIQPLIGAKFTFHHV